MTLHCLSKGRVLLLLYVDDIILIGDNSAMISDIKQYLHKGFTIKDLEQLRFFLGIEVNYVPDGIIMS